MRHLAIAVLLVTPLQPLHAGDWQLVWADEFNYRGLPDSKKWDYEEGFVRNQEEQYYTRGRAENARVENGYLIIEGRQEPFKNPRFDPNASTNNWNRSREFAGYTAASLITRGKASWRYGRVEVRAKLPQGGGVWPAIWMLGTNITTVGWPACGEIDIMEFVGHDPGHLHATVHWRGEGKHRSSGNKLATDRPFDDFHVYALEWFPDRMDFYYDQTKYHSFPLTKAGETAGNPFHQPHYLLINLALGGSWGGKIDDTILPQKFLIDYVRVYERASR
jgi:beta-glucanase (GH16 family)